MLTTDRFWLPTEVFRQHVFSAHPRRAAVPIVVDVLQLGLAVTPELHAGVHGRSGGSHQSATTRTGEPPVTAESWQRNGHQSEVLECVHRVSDFGGGQVSSSTGAGVCREDEVDGLSVMATVIGVFGTVAGIIGTLAGVRSSSARRYAERGADAAALLAALSTTETSRFFTENSDTNLRLELSRVVRESAAVYAKQYPTPAGNDAVRMLSATYAAMFAAFSVACLVVGLFERGNGRTADLVLAAVCLVLAGLLGAVAVTLLARVQRRNEARELSATPGRERFFETIHASFDDLHRHRAARRARREAQR